VGARLSLRDNGGPEVLWSHPPTSIAIPMAAINPRQERRQDMCKTICAILISWCSSFSSVSAARSAVAIGLFSSCINAMSAPPSNPALQYQLFACQWRSECKKHRLYCFFFPGLTLS
jgi:hypothetical protein